MSSLGPNYKGSGQLLPHFAFIGGSADIYITRMGLCEQLFGYFFAYFMLGAFAMLLISPEWADKIRTIGVLGTVCGGTIVGIWLLVPKLAPGKHKGEYR